jgi:fructokinase
MLNRSGGAMRCVGTGFVALDIIRSALDESATVERRHAGGSCGNTLAVLSYLGVSTAAVGRIGDDFAGRELLADLHRCRVDVTFLVPERDRRTPVVIQETFVDARGRARHRFSRACPTCGATMPGYRPLLAADVATVDATIPTHDLFFFDRVASGTLALARRARSKGALVVFEPSGIKDEELFVECLRVAHVLKYSRERLSGLDALVGRGSVVMEIETLGAEGLQFRMRKGRRLGAWSHLAALPALSIRDCAGSGDWCTAGLMAYLASGAGHPVTRIGDPDVVVRGLRFGQALAALNCSFDGARGLMYAATRSNVLKAAERLLTNAVPKLPRKSVPLPAAATRTTRTCAACAAVP